MNKKPSNQVEMHKPEQKTQVRKKQKVMIPFSLVEEKNKNKIKELGQ